MAPRPPVTLDVWSAALLDVMLPAGVNTGRPVLLACDDEAVRIAAQAVGVLHSDPVADLVAAINAEHRITQQQGFRDWVSVANQFANQQRPRAAPRHLAAMTLTVLAASRMDRDERHATQAYYARLCGLLEIEREEAWPHVQAFDVFVDRAFATLADWLAQDVAGARGLLHLPSDPAPRVVGVPISQTPLRGRDRRVLGSFFYRHEAALRSGWSPSQLLRRWGGASRLTGPAQALLDEPDLAAQVEGALRAAFRSWDGTRLDETGARLLPSRLWLLLRAGSLWLRLEATALTAPASAQGPTGVIEVPAAPDALTLPPEWLNAATDTRISLALNDGSKIPVLGPTMLFEQRDALERVPVAGDDPVWILTSDAELLPGDEREVATNAPPPWRLIADVEPAELPAGLRVEKPPGPGPEEMTELVGGLRLAPGVWLIDHPPAVAADVPEPLILEIDGEEVGEVEAGRLVPLGRKLGEGVHRVSYGATELVVELRSCGLREGIGELGHPLDRTAPAGARRLRHGVPSVRGALVVGAPSPDAAPELLVRTQRSLDVLYADGAVRPVAPPLEAEWQRAAGLAGVGRWEIPDGAHALAYAALAASNPYVVLLQGAPFPRTDAALDFAALHARADVIDRSPDASGEYAWNDLVAAADKSDGESG